MPATKTKNLWHVTDYFFDREKVIKMVSRRSQKALSKIGGLVRKIARRSIRKRKKPSAPGTPPSSHTGGLRDHIYYAYDPASSTVVIGPTPYNQKSYVFEGGGKGRNFIKGAVPKILEKGGVVGVRELWDSMTDLWYRVPWSFRLRERLVPVWKASEAERTSSVGVKTIYRGKRALNFYRIPPRKVKQRIRYATYPARPYMTPAYEKTKNLYPQLWSDAGASRFGGDE